MSDFFSRWHAIITPVAPTTAFEHIETGDAVSRTLARLDAMIAATRNKRITYKELIA